MTINLSSSKNNTHLQMLKLFEEERASLLRLCTAIVGNSSLAEDVLQETMFEAWRSLSKLRNPDAMRPWLAGIARNVCSRWLRKNGKDPAFSESSFAESESLFDQIPLEYDLEIELEKDELGLLLDRALALLPTETREILIRKFVADLPYKTIASQLGLSENGVAVRVHRGKLAIKRLLQTELQAEAEMFGLVGSEGIWRETRIWCTKCGQKRLEGRLDEVEFALCCPVCDAEERSYHSQDTFSDYSQCKTFRPVLNRFNQEMEQLFSTARQKGGQACRACGSWLQLKKGLPCYAPDSLKNADGLHLYCPECNAGSYTTLDGLALFHPLGWEFWKQEQRIRTLPQQPLEAEGVPAIHIPFESMKGDGKLDLIVTADLHEIIALHSNKAK